MPHYAGTKKNLNGREVKKQFYPACAGRMVENVTMSGLSMSRKGDRNKWS